MVNSWHDHCAMLGGALHGSGAMGLPCDKQNSLSPPILHATQFPHNNLTPTPPLFRAPQLPHNNSTQTPAMLGAPQPMSPIFRAPQLPHSGLTPTPPITPVTQSPIVPSLLPRRADDTLPLSSLAERWRRVDAEHDIDDNPATEFPVNTYREEIIKGRRWPLLIKKIHGSDSSASLVLSKGHYSDYAGCSEFTYTVNEVRDLTLPITSVYYTTTRASESVAEIARKHQLTARDLVNMNLRLENISVSSKFRVGTHLCVAGVLD